jgi:hypothetical protein
MSLVAANLVVAASLAGLIWTIQLVHYPLFALVGAAEWPRYEAEHQRRITWLAAPLMLANLALGIAVFVADASVLSALNGALAIGGFAATGLVFARMHVTLDPSGVARLVRANWARTAIWTAQVVVALALL